RSCHLPLIHSTRLLKDRAPPLDRFFGDSLKPRLAHVIVFTACDSSFDGSSAATFKCGGLIDRKSSFHCAISASARLRPLRIGKIADSAKNQVKEKLTKGRYTGGDTYRAQAAIKPRRSSSISVRL